MRGGLSTSLKERTQRVDPAAHQMREITAISAEGVKKTAADWNFADSLAGLTVFSDGGVQLTETSVTALDQTVVVGGSYYLLLNRLAGAQFDTARIDWGDTQSTSVELLSVTMRLAPNVSGGTQEVQQWVMQLFGLIDDTPANAPYTPSETVQLLPLAPPLYKTATAAEGDVVFSFAAMPNKPRPKSVSTPAGTYGTPGITRTYVMIWALKADGTPASNVGWARDNAHGSYSSGGNVLTRGLLSQTRDPTVGNPFAAPNYGSSWFVDAGAGGTVPRIKLVWNTGSAATITFTTKPADLADEVDNKTYEVDVTGTQVVNGSTIVWSAAFAHSGTHSAKVTTANLAASGIRATRAIPFTFPYDDGYIPVQGLSCQLSAWVYAPAGSVGKTLRLTLGCTDGYGTGILPSPYVDQVLVLGWQAFSVTGTLPPGTVTIEPYIHTGVAAQGIFDFYVDDWAGPALVLTDQTVEFTGTGETPNGSSLTYAVQADDATWLAFVDGQTTDDLTTANPTHPITKRFPPLYAVRATLTPTSAGDGTPTLRTLGVRSLVRYDCTQITMLNGGETRVDPATLKASIATATLVAIKDGEADFRDLISTILSTYQLGQLSVRTFWGAEDLARGSWMHQETYLVDDYRDAAGGIEISLLSVLVLLRGVLPIFDPNTGLREALVYSAATIADVWVDLITGQLGIPGRYVGPGPTDTKAISKTIPSNVTSPQARAGSLVSILLDQQGWQTVQAKDQVDAVSSFAGGTTIASQGRFKWVPICVGDIITRPDGSYGFAITQVDAPRVVFSEGEVQWIQVGPGFAERVPEYYVPYNWNVAVQKFGFEHRAYNGPGLLNLGVGRMASQPTVLEADVAQWIVSDGGTAILPTSSLARRIATRQATLLGTGMMLWRFRSTYAYPELECGDTVAVPTDRFVAMNPISSGSIVGRYWANAVIVETNPNGRDFGVWIRQWADLAPTLATGTVNGADDLERCHLSLTASQTISNVTDTALAWTSESEDTAALHDPGSNTKITIPPGGSVGSWSFTAYVLWAATIGGGIRRVQIRKNGAGSALGADTISAHAGNPIQTLTILDHAAPGDYYEVWVYQSDGGTIDVVGTLPEYSSFKAKHHG